MTATPSAITPYRIGGGVLVLALVLVSPAAAQDEAPAPRSPTGFDRYRSFLWMHGGPPVDPILFAALADLGISGTNVAGTAPSGVHARAGIPFYVDHTAGKGTLFLREEVWKAARDAWLEKRDPALLGRPFCLSRVETLEAVERRIAEVVAAAAPNGPSGYALDDEISLTSRNNPFDFCRDPECLERFRAALARRYGSPERLARAWGTPVQPFSEVLPFSTDEIRRRELQSGPETWNLAPWAEHRRFMDRTFSRAVRRLANRVTALDSAVPVGFTGGEAPSPFSGVDFARLCEFLDFLEPYDIGGSRELVRSFARPDCVVLRTLFARSGDPRLVVHELWDYFLRGDRGVILWCAADFFQDDDPAQPTPWARALAPTLRALAGDAATEYLRARPIPPAVAVLESSPSNRLHWMLDSRFDGRAWVNRLSSYEVTHSSQNRTREAWQKLLEDLGWDYVHVTPSDLDERRLAPFSVLVLPRSIALADAAVREIEHFAKRGVVLADCQLGLFTDDLRARPRAAFDDRLGLERRGFGINLREATFTGTRDPSRPDFLIAEPGLRGGLATPALLEVDGAPAVLVHNASREGRIVYLNLLLTEYLAQRGGRRESALLAEIRRCLRSAAVTPFARVRNPADAPFPVRLHVREDGERRYLGAIANWRTSTVPVDEAAVVAAEPVDIEIVLSARWRVVDLRAAADAEPSEPTTVIRGRLTPFEPLLYRLEP